MRMNWNSSWGASLALGLAAACWGFGTVMVKGVLQSVPPLTVLLAQLLVSLSLLWLMIAAWRIPVRFGRETLLLSLTGILNPGLAYVLSLLGLALTTASMSTLIWAAEPIVILALAWLALRERVTPPVAICAVIGVLGVVLVAGLSLGPSQTTLLTGNLLTMVGVFCCATHSIVTRRLIHRVHPLLFLALQQTAALVLVLPLWTIELRRVGLGTLVGAHPSVWVGAAVSGILYYALAYGFYLTALVNVPVSRASLFFNLIPIFAVGAAYLFLGERLTVLQSVGAVLILGAMVGVLRLQFSQIELSKPNISPRMETPTA